MDIITVNDSPFLISSDPFAFNYEELVVPARGSAEFDWTWDISLTPSNGVFLEPLCLPLIAEICSRTAFGTFLPAYLDTRDPAAHYLTMDWSGISPSHAHLLVTNSAPTAFILQSYGAIWNPPPPIPEPSAWLLLSLGLLLVPFFLRAIRPSFGERK